MIDVVIIFMGVLTYLAWKMITKAENDTIQIMGGVILIVLAVVLAMVFLVFAFSGMYVMKS